LAFIKVAGTVVITFGLIFAPYYVDIPQVLSRIFPFNRGLYEDKVANFWCAFKPFLDMRQFFPQEQIIKYR
jgi:alpha-1,3-glucosyltransferase